MRLSIETAGCALEEVAALRAERDALAEKVKAMEADLREVNGCNRPDCPHAGNFDAIDAAGGGDG